ncbi:unnamed protein product [Dicrocoelium dendriticum]|nr:unnamed protein product [Dicrocoelium dendriticum]
MSSKCLSCSKRVTSRSKAVQCALCEGWLHTSCCNIDDALYECLQRTASEVMSSHCDSCRVIVNDKRLLANHRPLSICSPVTLAVDNTEDELPPSSISLPASGSATPKPNRTRTLSATSAESLPSSKMICRPRNKPATYAAVASATAPTSTSLCPAESTPPRKLVSKPKAKSNTGDNPSIVKGNVPPTFISQSPATNAVKFNPKSGDKPNSKLSASQSRMKLVLNRLSELEKVIKENPSSRRPQMPERTPPSRDRCLIIMNAAESNKATPAERILDDQILLERLISLLFDEGEQGINIVSAFRLGRKQEDPTKFRPLKVVCQTEEECRRILRRTSRLKGEPYYVLRDLSPEDRIKMKKAVEELRTRRGNGETDLHIVDFCVVRKTLRARWRPILLIPGQ